MRASILVPALAAALAAGPWAESAAAQVPPVPLEAGHGSGAAAGSSVDGARQAAGNADTDSAASLRRQALTTMESLREEIATLAALRDAQAALVSWNRESAKTGEAPASLPAALCAETALAAWCPLLPATFGFSSTELDHVGG